MKFNSILYILFFTLAFNIAVHAQPASPPGVSQSGSVTAGHSVVWNGNRSIKDGGSGSQNTILCLGSNDTALFTAVAGTSGNYYVEGPCVSGQVSWTASKVRITFAPGASLSPSGTIDWQWKFTGTDLSLYNLNVTGGGAVQNPIWVSTGSSLISWNTKMDNVGYPVSTATAAVFGIRLDGALGWSIYEGSFTNFHSVGNGSCSDAIGEVRHIYDANSGFGVISNVYSATGDGAEDNDYFHAETNTTGGVIYHYTARYNDFTRRVLKFQSGNWSVLNSDIREGSDFSPVSGSTQIGAHNTNAVEWAANTVGTLNVSGGYYGCEGYAGCIGQNGLGIVNIGAVTMQGPTLTITRPSYGSNCINTASGADAYGAYFFTSDTGSIVHDAVIKNFGVGVGLLGAGSAAINNTFDDPVNYGAMIGTSTAKDGSLYSDNNIITRTSGYINNAQVVNIQNNTNIKANSNRLVEEGNATHAAVFIEFTNAGATGYAKGNISPSSTTVVKPGSSAVKWAQNVMVLPYCSVGSSSATWTAMPAAETIFIGSSRNTVKVDLSNYTQVRLVARMATLGVAGAVLTAKYDTVDGGTTVGNYSNIGTSAVSTSIQSSSYTTSAWIDLAAGAKADVWVALTGTGGDGITSPAFGNVYLEFR